MRILQLSRTEEPTIQPVDINVNEVLQDFGLDPIVEVSDVTQRNNSITVGNTDINDFTTDTTTDSANVSFNLDEIFQDNNEELVEASESVDTEDSDAESSVESLQPATLNVIEEPTITTTTTEPTQSSDGNIATEDLVNRLPPNSPSLNIDISRSRFSGAMWFNAIQQSKVILAGLGGIGSYVLYCLSRMNPKQIFLYDDDVVELANLSGQFYSESMIGRTKVDAMASLARDFSKFHNVVAIPQKFTPETPAGDIMLCGFDNMEARMVYFNSWLNHVYKSLHPENCLFIDGRLNMEEFQVFCMKGDDTFNIKRYTKECLFTDDQAESVQCSMKQTAYCSNMIGSIIVNLFTNFIANKLNPAIERDLPFKVYYNASLMYFKTEL